MRINIANEASQLKLYQWVSIHLCQTLDDFSINAFGGVADPYSVG